MTQEEYAQLLKDKIPNQHFKRQDIISRYKNFSEPGLAQEIVDTNKVMTNGFHKIKDRSLDVGRKSDDLINGKFGSDFVGPQPKANAGLFDDIAKPANWVGSKIANGVENVQSFGLRRAEFLSSEFTTRHAIARTANFINPFNASVRSDAMNSVGFLTKSQKMQEKITGSLINRAMITGLVGGMALYNSINNPDDNPILSMAAFAASSTITFGAFAVGRAAGGAVGTALSRSAYHVKRVAGNIDTPYSIGKMGKALRIGGATVGAVAGAVAGVGLLAASGLEEGIKNMTKSDNAAITNAAHIFDSAQYASRFQSQETMTMRQQALSKMSRAGLNDRALMLGNEALVSKGLM